MFLVYLINQTLPAGNRKQEKIENMKVGGDSDFMSHSSAVEMFSLYIIGTFNKPAVRSRAIIVVFYNNLTDAKCSEDSG